MRIVAGSLGGRQFQAPHGHRTHPMSEKIRGALFNMLGDISGLTFLDAFAGSGAISFEAISRGAVSVTAIDVDKQATDVIKANTSYLNLDKQLKCIQANVQSWSRNNPSAKFDVVVADPPYDQDKSSQVASLTGHLASNGLLVVSQPTGQPVLELANFTIAAQKTYGDAELIFYKHTI